MAAHASSATPKSVTHPGKHSDSHDPAASSRLRRPPQQRVVQLYDLGSSLLQHTLPFSRSSQAATCPPSLPHPPPGINNTIHTMPQDIDRSSSPFGASPNLASETSSEMGSPRPSWLRTQSTSPSRRPRVLRQSELLPPSPRTGILIVALDKVPL